MTFCARCGKELPSGANFCPNCGATTTFDSASASSSSTAQSASSAQVPISGFDALTKEGAVQEYWLRRLVAFVIDAIVVYVAIAIVALIVSIPSFVLSGFSFGALPFAFLGAGAFTLASGLLFVLYFVAAEATGRSSVGKHALGLRVRTDSGRNPTVVESFVRNVSKIYWLLLLLDVVIGLAVSRDYHQKFSDRYAHTTVKRVP